MANILTSYPIRYTQDLINTNALGIIICSDSNYLDLSQADIVQHITFQTQPAPLPSTCNCRLVFNSGSGWFRLNSTGNAERVETQELSAESVLDEGNTISELEALTDIPAFVNTRLRYAIALESADPYTVRPKVKFSVKCMNLTEVLSKTTLSPKYEWNEAILIKDIFADSSIFANGEVDIKAKYTDAHTGTESDWGSIDELRGLEVTSLQFKVLNEVQEQNSDRSILKSIQVDYTRSENITVPENVSEIFTITKDWRNNLHNCRVVVRHSQLDGSAIKCYAAIRSKPVKVKGENIGVIPGQTTVQTYNFAHPEGININSVNIYNNNVKKVGGYDIDSENGQIIFTEPQDTYTTIDYEYGWGAEQWVEMTLDKTDSFDSFDQSVYRVNIPESVAGNIQSIAGIRLALETTKGRINREPIGQGKGVLTTYKLSKPVRDGKIEIKYTNMGGLELDSWHYVLDSNTSFVKVNAEAGAAIDASYNWESISPTVYQVEGIFSE